MSQRINVYDLPDQHYEDAERIADAIQPVLQELVGLMAEKYDAPTAAGIGAASLIFLMSGLSDTYDDMGGQGRDDAAMEEFVGAITDAVNKRAARAAARMNGELN